MTKKVMRASLFSFKKKYELQNRAFSISKFYSDISEINSIAINHKIRFQKDDSLKITPIEIGHVHRHYWCRITKEGTVLQVEYLITRFMKAAIIICSIIFIFSIPILYYLSLFFDIGLWLFWGVPSICLFQIIALYFGSFYSMLDFKQKNENFILNWISTRAATPETKAPKISMIKTK